MASILILSKIDFTQGGDILKLENNRAGQLKKMQSDYQCFVPHNLKDIKLNIDSEINALVNKAYLL